VLKVFQGSEEFADAGGRLLQQTSRWSTVTSSGDSSYKIPIFKTSFKTLDGLDPVTEATKCNDGAKIESQVLGPNVASISWWRRVLEYFLSWKRSTITVRYWCTECPDNPPEFTSKGDWKRHDNAKHFQIEAWYCETCHKLFHRDALFREHLQDKHWASSNEVEKHIKEAWIRRNGQGSIWCGFCMKVIVVVGQGQAAWNERYDHLTVHFEGGSVIDDWVDVNSNKPRGETMRKRRKRAGNKNSHSALVVKSCK
jgi:hypothetical protein